MKPIEITLDITKINKAKITERTYKNKDGETITVKEYKIKVIPLKQRKFVTKGKDWEMFKTHFVVEKKDNKEEPDNFVGNGFEFVKQEITDEEAEKKFEAITQDDNYPNDEINSEDIPF